MGSRNAFSGQGSSSFGPQVNNMIQREMEDTGSQLQNTVSQMQENIIENISTEVQSASEQTIKDKIIEQLPEVTPQQLNALAEKLIPRIKRLIRNEMERSIFR